jgi:glyoxylase-like metal-dependent hydrolase (beta-lactamase superfamily II)
MHAPHYQLQAIESAPFGQVAYVLWRAGRPDALVIDPGFDTESIRAVLDRHGLDVAAILNTHGHADHIAGNEFMKRAFPNAPLIIGANETTLLADPNANLSALYGMPLHSPAADRVVNDGETLELAGFSFQIREIPGHSPGSVVFYCGNIEPAFVFVGDVLFSGSIGRTDLGGDMNQLLTGIRAKLFNLPDATIVLPGHGPTTTIGKEKSTNPFVGEQAVVYRPGPR